MVPLHAVRSNLGPGDLNSVRIVHHLIFTESDYMVASPQSAFNLGQRVARALELACDGRIASAATEMVATLRLILVSIHQYERGTVVISKLK